MRGLWHLFRTDLKLYLREPAAAFFTLAFPALVFVIGGYTFGQEEVFTTSGGVDLRVVDLMLPSTLAWVMASQGLMGVYPVFTSLRESKALKYYRTHPIRAGHLLLSQYAVGLIMLLASMLVLGLVGQALFGLRSDAHILAFALTMLLTYTAFFVLGFAFAGLTPTARLAQALGSVIFFPLLFLSGSVGPRTDLPPVLKFISDLSPLSHANDTLIALWTSGAEPLAQVLRTPLPTFGVDWGGRTWWQGVTPLASLAYLAGLTVVAAAVALRTFRWDDEPRRSPRRGPAQAEPVPQTEAAVWARGLRKRYGPVQAVDRVDVHIRPGEIFGLLGPNGAGKTTTVEMLEGLRPPDAGVMRVLGLDPQRDYPALVPRIGVQLQEASLPPRLKVREALRLFAAFYDRTLPEEVLLERLGLHDQADAFFGRLSGGQKQRVFAALALVNDPEVVFVDEITTGLDPAIRRQIWGFLRELRQAGKTIVLTTHYLDEAQALCDRVVILRQGKVVAQGHPMGLIEELGARFRLEVEVDDPEAVAWEDLPAVLYGEVADGVLTLYLQDEAGLEAVLAALRRAGVALRNLRWQPVSLEDVFLMLTREDAPQPMQEVAA